MDMQALYSVLKFLGPTSVSEQGVETYEFEYRGNTVTLTIFDGEVQYVFYGSHN